MTGRSRFTYDAEARAAELKLNSVLLASYAYDAIGRTALTTDVSGHTLSYQYDGLNRVTKATFPDGTFEQVDWGCCNIERTVDREGRSTSYTYDGRRRLIELIRPDSSTIRYGYDPIGNLTRLEHAGAVTTWQYDYYYGETLKTYPGGSTERTTVGVSRSEYVDRMDQETLRVYDEFGNLLSVTSPLLPELTYTYDAYDRITSMTYGGDQTTYAHDVRGLVTQIDGPWDNDIIAYSYDDLGRQINRAVNGVAAGCGYDTLGRVVQTTNVLGQFNYAFDGNSSRLTQVQYPNAQISSYAYLDAANDFRLGTITHTGADANPLSRFGYTYSSTGRIQSWEQQSGSATAQVYDFSYDSLDQLTGAVLKDKLSAEILASYGYTYDAAGNRTVESRQVRGAAVGERLDTHNTLNQITGSTRRGLTRVIGSVDKPSKVTVNGQPALLKANLTYESWNQLPSGHQTLKIVATDGDGNTSTSDYDLFNDDAGGLYLLTYDANGNLLSDGLRSFQWDSRNRLTATETAKTRSEFGYDGLGRRVRIIEKRRADEQSAWQVDSEHTYLWCGTRICEKRDATGAQTLARYFGNGEQRIGGGDAGNYYFTRNHLGSVREVTDQNGQLRGRYEYGLWGRRTKIEGDLDIEFGYTGHHFHAPSRLHLTLYRAYDGKLGRWLSPDPIKEDGGINLYGYVLNDPINLWDPDGMAPMEYRKMEGGGGGSPWGDTFGGASPNSIEALKYLLSPSPDLDGSNTICMVPIGRGAPKIPKIKIPNPVEPEPKAGVDQWCMLWDEPTSD